MNFMMVILRLLHIAGGIFWTGGALLMDFFIGPTIGATEQAGKQFAAHLMIKTRLVTVMTSAAIITILAGTALYWNDSNGFHSGWMQSGAGIGYAIGGIAGLIGAIFGITFGSLNRKMAKIGVQAKGNPTPEQFAEMQKIQKQVAKITPVHLFSITVAIVFMATARYFAF